MSGILALTGAPNRARLRSALSRLASLGGDEQQRWSGDDVTIAVTRKQWELSVDFSRGTMILETPDVVVATDASLYHREKLSSALHAARVTLEGRSPAHLIAAAYRAWGTALVDHLSGDYAFVLWDRKRHVLLGARDPLGSRALFRASVGSGVALASSARALAELAAPSLNLASLGTQVAGLAWSVGAETAFSGVAALEPGHRIVVENGTARTERFWHPRAAPDPHATSAPEAAEELRELLCIAVTERLSADVTTVWMSGGWDSTAVFAAGQHALGPPGRGRLRPVSISYPEGDPGREDELIRDVAGRWDADVHWLDSEQIPLLDGLARRAAGSDEPPAHLYELWNCALARGTRASGSRIALDGGGGDQLFQLSDIVLAQLLREGRFLEFARVARARGARGWRHLVRTGVLPLLPDHAIEIMERVLGRRIPRHYLERSLAEWMRPEFVRQHALRERDLGALRQRRVKSLAQSESLLYLTLPVWSHGASFMRGALLREGVEVRSPLLDRAIVEFALARPIAERASATETKTLLRRSMQGLLPAAFLGPRKYRTGMTIGFSRRRMRESYPGLVSELFAKPLLLAELGMVDGGKLRAAAERCCRGGGDEYLRVNLFHAMKVEFWLRGLEAPSGAARAPREPQDAGAVRAPAA